MSLQAMQDTTPPCTRPLAGSEKVLHHCHTPVCVRHHMSGHAPFTVTLLCLLRLLLPCLLPLPLSNSAVAADAM